MEKLVWHNEKRIIKDLLPYEFNPRQITAKQVEDLKKSLSKFGLVEIPVIDIDNVIVAGHQRLKIMQILGHGEEEIDVRVPNRKLTEEEFKEYNIRSNKNVGEWDFDILANNFDMDDLTSWGFETTELDKYFSEEPTEQDDKIPEVPKEPQTTQGDIYQLGNHVIVCGDSKSEIDIKKLMGNKKSKLIFTSPPYNMNAAMYKSYDDNMKSEEYINFNLDVIKKYKEYLSGFIFWNISYNKNSRWEFLEIMYRIIKETGLKFLELIVWNKKHGLPITSKKMLTRQYEDVLLVGDDESFSDLELFFCGDNDDRVWFNKKTQKNITNYWEIDTNNTQLDTHSACYPVALPIRGILLMTEPNDIVVDPFMGSGSTLIACVKTNRICYGMEFSPEYVDVIIQRYVDFTNNNKIIKNGKIIEWSKDGIKE